jgi:hypothetical protein
MTERTRCVQIGLTHPHAAGLRETLLQMPDVKVDGADPIPDHGGAVGIAAIRRLIAAAHGEATAVDSIDDALRVLETLDAAQESARTGRTVRLDRRR